MADFIKVYLTAGDGKVIENATIKNIPENADIFDKFFGSFARCGKNQYVLKQDYHSKKYVKYYSNGGSNITETTDVTFHVSVPECESCTRHRKRLSQCKCGVPDIDSARRKFLKTFCR